MKSGQKTVKSEIDGAIAPSAQGIAASAKAAQAVKGMPPIHLWNPPFCGDLDMRIARDGTWYYEGGAIERAPLVRLFSTILKREDGKYFLVTPVEKVGITVDDAPFVAIDFEQQGGDLIFQTNVGDSVIAGPENVIRMELGEDGEPSPYLHVRAGLEALIDRKSFYRLVEIGEHEGDMFGVRSGGVFFPFIESAAMQ